MKFKKAFLNLMLFFWAIICVAIYIFNLSHRGGIHLISLAKLNPNTMFQLIADSHFLVLLVDTFKAFVGIVLLSMSTIGLGLTFIKLIDRKKVTSNEGNKIVITAYIFGQILFSIALLLLLIAFKRFTLLSIIIIFFIGLFSFFLQLQYFRYSIRQIGKETWIFFTDPKVLFLVLLSIILFGSTLLFSSSRLGYDAASLYFAQAKMIALSERLNILSYKDTFAGSSLYITILQSATIQLFGDQAARIYSWINGIAIFSLGVMTGIWAGISRRASFYFFCSY